MLVVKPASALIAQSRKRRWRSPQEQPCKSAREVIALCRSHDAPDVRGVCVDARGNTRCHCPMRTGGIDQNASHTTTSLELVEAVGWTVAALNSVSPR